MSEQSGETPAGQNHESIQAEAQKLLEDIRQLRARAEEHLQATEKARKKADEDALYAYQAKVNTEEHSKSAAAFKGKAEADLNSIATNKQNFDELVINTTKGKAAIEADIKVIDESRKRIEQTSGGIMEAAETGKSRLEKIEEIKKNIDALFQETESMRDLAIQARNKSETAQTHIEQTANQTNELLNKLQGILGTSEQNAHKINEILTTANSDRENLTDITKRLAQSHEIATEFETRVTRSSTELESLIKKADGLLPGFTSVSLASAFGNHKRRFLLPKILWIGTFVICIVGLIIVAYPSFRAAISATPIEKSWQDIWFEMVMRLPIVIPLVWLAIYAGKNYMLSIRIEEDYAYKEAISTSFEGYKREMEKIAPGDGANPTPLTTLCNNALSAIAERPGRIYDGKTEDITIFNEAHGAAEKVVDFSKKQLAAK